MVGKDGDFKAALTAATAASSIGERFRIFFPDGEYDLGTLTGDNNQKTVISLPNVSYIGQSAEKVVLFNKPASEGIGVTATVNFTSSAKNLYMQDITLLNKMDYRTGTLLGRAVALQDQGNKNIYKKNDIKIHKDEEAWLITEFSFLSYLVNHISEYDVIKNMLSKDDFSNEESREIFDMLSDKNLSDVVKEKFKGKNIKHEVISSEQIYNLMLIIKKNSLKMKINHLLEEQKKLDSSNEKDQRRLIEIGMSVMEFTKELDNL